MNDEKKQIRNLTKSWFWILSQSRRRMARRYRKAFGKDAGREAYYQLRLRPERSAKSLCAAVRIPQIATPVYSRTKTSDVEILEQLFFAHAFNLPLPIEPKVIVDGGANVGYASLIFANRYPQARIIAIEPELSNFEMLRRNTEAYPNIEIIHAALWNQKTSLSVIDPDALKSSFQMQVADSMTAATCPSITMPEILAMCGPLQIDILKLDIEGAEKEIFSDPDDTWLKQVNVLFVELHERYVTGCGKAFFAATGKYNFNFLRDGEYECLIRFAPEE
jgi:FkbM family methyltransferase